MEALKNLLSTLRMRIFLLFGLLFVAILVVDQAIERFGLPLASFEGRFKERQREAFRALDLTADLKKERLILWIEERKADLNVVAESPVIQSSLAKVEKEFHQVAAAGKTDEEFWARIRRGAEYREIRQHIDIMMNSYQAYERIDLVDLHSGVVMVSTDETVQGYYIFDDVTGLSDLSSLRGYMVNIWRHPEGHDLDMHIARSIRATGAEESGLALLMHIDTGHFLEPLLHTGGGLGKTGEALLVDSQAGILTPLKFPLPEKGEAVPLEYRIPAEPARLAASREEGIISSRDYRGVPVLAAYRFIEVSPDTSWGLVVKRDAAEVFSGYRRENLLSLILIIVGIFFVVASTYFLADSLTGPLSGVSETAKRIREGDLTARARVEGTEEVKVLAETFNAMVRELKIYMDQLQEKNEELEAFVYTAAHDLKNPLIGAQGYLNLLSRTLPGKLNHNQEHLLERTTVTLQRFERILDDLLEYSQVRAEPPETGSVDLDSLIKRIKAEQWERIRGSGARIIVQENLPEIQLNESRAYQIFSNLVSNSLKFTRNGVTPVIEIGMIPHPQEAVAENHSLFFVTDNGIGIDPMWHDRIFGLFERVDQNRGDGSGTGLAIVRRIIRQVSGKIWVKSTRGSGATFYFSLPTS
ncbi:MAG: HAMP domain-containing protein [bacterium]|nr:MAG: HAMP domain-containing protein [bacterium]